MNVRFSAANLAPWLINADSGEKRLLGFLNRKRFVAGWRVFGAIGGAAKMTEEGMVLLRDKYGAEFTHGCDARLRLDCRHLNHVARLFESHDPRLCEFSPFREVVEELAGCELPGFSAVLSAEEASQVHVHHVQSIYQITESKDDQSVVGIHRHLRLFEMLVPATTYRRLGAHSATRLYTEAEALRAKEVMHGLTDRGCIFDPNIRL